MISLRNKKNNFQSRTFIWRHVADAISTEISRSGPFAIMAFILIWSYAKYVQWYAWHSFYIMDLTWLIMFYWIFHELWKRNKMEDFAEQFVAWNQQFGCTNVRFYIIIIRDWHSRHLQQMCPTWRICFFVWNTQLVWHMRRCCPTQYC